MGTWGAGLYQDDTACDVRDDYIRHLKSGLSDAASTRQILKRFGKLLRDTQIACMVYLALADTQWHYGRLDAAVKKRALGLLRKGADLSSWEKDSPQLVNARKKVLASLGKRLRTKPKARREVKVEPPKALKTWTDAKLGTVFLLPLSSSTFAALVLIGHAETGYRTKDPVFAVLKWKGKREPTLTEVRQRKFVAVSEDSESHGEIGFLMDNQRMSPMTPLTRTDIIVPKFPRYSRRGYFTGVERIVELVDAAIAGRRPPPTEWELKFGRGRSS